MLSMMLASIANLLNLRSSSLSRLRTLSTRESCGLPCSSGVFASLAVA